MNRARKNGAALVTSDFQNLKKTARATVLRARDMDFSGEKSWLVEMHGRRLVVHGREQAEVVLLA
jgi:hypothetical protein